MWPNMFFNEWIGLAPLFARFFGLFCLSPLFSRAYLPWNARLALALLCTCLLVHFIPTQSPSALLLIQELLIGYLLGVLFSFLFEGAALAGQLVGTLGGFSATELFDPLTNSSDPLLSRFFASVLLIFFFLLDGHHLLLRFLYESFQVLPNHPSSHSLKEIAWASGQLFSYALEFAMIPLFFLGAVIIVWSLAARFLPQVQIFWIGLPINVLVALVTIALALAYFPQKLDTMLQGCLLIAKKALFSL